MDDEEGVGTEAEGKEEADESVALRRIIEIAAAALAGEASEPETENGQKMPMRPAMEGNMPEQAIKAMALRNQS
jgi:hypothetical protein